MAIKANKYYKIRLYPTKEQEGLLKQHIGICRYVWNSLVVLQKEVYESTGNLLSMHDMEDCVESIRNDALHGWVNDVSSFSLNKVCQDFKRANSNFLHKKAEFPTFKRKKEDRQSYSIASKDVYFCNESKIHINVIGDVEYKSDYKFQIGKANILRNIYAVYENNEWFINFSMERENQMSVLNNEVMGIDMGIDSLATVAFGDRVLIFENISSSQEVQHLEWKLRRLQKDIARKYKTNEKNGITEKSKNIERCEEEVSGIKQRLVGIRDNYIHQITHSLVSANPSKVVIKTIEAGWIAEGKYLKRTRYEECRDEFIRQMKYKCERMGIEFVVADRKYPSNKICANCGNMKTDFKFKDTIYKCDACGLEIPRDINSALNLCKYTPNLI